LAVGFHAVRQGRLVVGETVAIIGAGPIGICTLIAAKAAGASKVIMSEISKPRRDRALAMGADVVINPEEADLVKQVGELTDGLGADVAIDCVGIQSSGPLAVDLARKAGTAVIVGISSAPSEFSFMTLWATEKIVLGSQGYAREASFVLDLLAKGKINADGLVTAKVPLGDGVEKGFEELANNPEKHLKILLQSP
jgi:(R,R)-butanediol dehydrogenase/meso-butanediol dehydrogenase/diacetyl reductase